VTIGINDITSGIAIKLEDKVYVVDEYHHVKPGKGAAFVRVRLRDLRTDLVIERTFRTAERIDDVFLEQKQLQYLYRAGDMFHFMCQESYEEVMISENKIGDGIKFLQDNIIVNGLFIENQIVKIILPNFLITQIMETEPGIKGDSSRAGTKPAKIDTGATVLVPLFINVGDWIKIDTRTGGEYVERVQK